MTYSQQDGARDRQPERAAIFVDYENLFRTLGHSADGGASPSPIISEMIEALQRSLLEERQTQSAVTRAYADFASLENVGERVQRSLYLQGVEPHFVPRARAEEAVETQLCVDAMDLLHHRSDVSTFVLLTGRRIYLPLVRMFKRYGRSVLVVGLDEPAALEEIPHMEGNWFFPAGDLLSAATRERIAANSAIRSSVAPDDLEEINDPILIQTLEIIDEHFGQYEEVYLTPLLRKLSELLDERRYDPKNLISDLEDLHAVRLEKRQGFPHDYTVLILEEHHPIVRRVLADAHPYGTYYYEDARDDQSASPGVEIDGAYQQNGQASYDKAEPNDDRAFDGDVPDPQNFEETDSSDPAA